MILVSQNLLFKRNFVPLYATGHAQGRASDRADVFANSIKSLASDFGGQANLEDNFFDDD